MSGITGEANTSNPATQLGWTTVHLGKVGGTITGGIGGTTTGGIGGTSSASRRHLLVIGATTITGGIVDGIED